MTSVHMATCELTRPGSPRRGDEDTSWLSLPEVEVLGALRDPHRRAGWLAGRKLAKQLILGHCTSHQKDEETGPADITILSRDGLGRGTRPRASWQGQFQPWSVSIAHSDTMVVAVLCRVPGMSVGVDVTPVQPWRSGALEMWFSPDELAWMRETGDAAHASTLWAVKEAIYKCTNRGETFAPRNINALEQREGCRVETTAHDGHVIAVAVAGDGVGRER